jgi:predicted RNase H-like nuclease (RuvC/YqgF family)
MNMCDLKELKSRVSELETQVIGRDREVEFLKNEIKRVTFEHNVQRERDVQDLEGKIRGLKWLRLFDGREYDLDVKKARMSGRFWARQCSKIKKILATVR